MASVAWACLVSVVLGSELLANARLGADAADLVGQLSVEVVAAAAPPAEREDGPRFASFQLQGQRG